jgi:SpoVK/Ycf46/Vps4 family AAA+-type ATPase
MKKRGSSDFCFANDNNDNFILMKCIQYMQRHMNSYYSFDRETIEFLCWVLGDLKIQLGEYILDYLDERNQNKFRTELSEYNLDYIDFTRTVFDMLVKIKTKYHKDINRHIENILAIRSLSLKDNDRSETEKTAEKIKIIFNLNSNEIELCMFLFIINSYDPPEDFFLRHLKCDKYMGKKHLCNILNINMQDINEIISSTLVQNGLIEIDKYDVCLSDDFLCMFQNPSAPVLSKYFYKKVPKKTVRLQHHFVSNEQTEHILSMLREKPEFSTHILLYGKPGTGKTSYSCSLVKKLNVPCYEIAQNSDNTSKNRRAAITAALNMSNSGKGSVIIVDEADNILNTRHSWFMRGETQDKGYLNQLLEKPGVRIIWICNSIDNIDDSVLRRFSFSLKFKQFNRKQRIRLFENIIRDNRVKRYFTHDDIKDLARKYNVNAGIIDLSVKKALESNKKTKNGFIGALKIGLDSYMELINGSKKVCDADMIESAYSLDGMNIHGNIDTVIDQVEKFSNHLVESQQCVVKNMNLLFYGPPGTGKSELARYIGNKLDREVISKRLSDILSPFVGMAEKNIRSAFDEAEREEAILVIDEADSLIFSRKKAIRSWESSQTNEFLTAMERFKGILICTTNMIKEIDNASIRRFNFKIKFDCLEPEGNVIFYNKLLFPLIKTPINADIIKLLRRIENLAPGDFKTVRDRFAFYPQEELGHQVFVEALTEEAEIKYNHNNKRCIGF